MDEYVEFVSLNIYKTFPKPYDAKIADAILELFRKREGIDIFNKKALYIYIREMSDANTQQITRMVKFLKDKYRIMYNDYLQYGYIPKDKTY